MTQTLVHDDLVSVVRDFTRRELLPRTQELDAARPDVISDVWHRLVELNLDRALLADDLGGVGLGIEDFLCVLQEVAAGDAGIALMVLLNNAAMISLPAPVARGLPEAARWTLAVAPGTDDPIGESVVCTPDGATGRLAAVFGAVGADGVVVTIRGPQPTVFAVDAGAFTVHPDPLQMGLRAAVLADLEFGGAEVTTVPGPDAAAVEARARSLVHCGVAAISHGIARRAGEIALAYAHTRIQGGAHIVEHDAVSDMLAEMAVRSRIFAGTRLGAASDDPAAVLAHKIAAADAALATTIDAVQVMGGIGYMVDTGVEKLMRDAKYLQLYPQRNWLARAELMSLSRKASG